MWGGGGKRKELSTQNPVLGKTYPSEVKGKSRHSQTRETKKTCNLQTYFKRMATGISLIRKETIKGEIVKQ